MYAKRVHSNRDSMEDDGIERGFVVFRTNRKYSIQSSFVPFLFCFFFVYVYVFGRVLEVGLTENSLIFMMHAVCMVRDAFLYSMQLHRTGTSN